MLVLQSELIKEAVEYFKKTLKVRRVETPITLFRLLWHLVMCSVAF